MSGKDLLAEYNKKRDFKKTAEPAGKRATSGSGNRFIVQKHDATPGGGRRGGAAVYCRY